MPALPACLTTPVASIKILDEGHEVEPTLSGFVLKPHSEYEFEVTVPGLSPDQWTVKHGRKPSFVSNVIYSEVRGAARVLTVSTQRPSSDRLSIFLEFGGDLPLKVTFDDDDYAAQTIMIPLATRLSLWKLVVAVVLFVVTFALEPFLSSSLSAFNLSLLLKAFAISVGSVAIMLAVRFFVLPLWRYREIKRRAVEQFAFRE